MNIKPIRNDDDLRNAFKRLEKVRVGGDGGGGELGGLLGGS